MGRSLSFLDKSFWLAESDASPKHVGCVQILEMPEQACASEYVRALYEEVKSHTKRVNTIAYLRRIVFSYFIFSFRLV